MRPPPRSSTALVLLAAVAAGCYSDSPLDPSPQVPLDTALLGSWNCVTADPEEPKAATATFSASPGDEHEYRLTWQGPGDEADSYRAFVSSVRGGAFLNVRPLEENRYTGWAFLRYSFPRNGVLHVEMVRDEPFEGSESHSSPKAARATLEKALERTPGPLQEFCVCIRPAIDAGR